MSTITIELDPEQSETLELLAQRTERSPDAVLLDAMAFYALLLEQGGDQPPLSAEQIAQIEAGLEALRRGETIPHEEVMADARRLLGL